MAEALTPDRFDHLQKGDQLTAGCPFAALSDEAITLEVVSINPERANATLSARYMGVWVGNVVVLKRDGALRWYPETEVLPT